MSKVSFLASMAIRTLILGAKQQRRRGDSLVLLSPHPDAEKVLEMTGVIDLLPTRAMRLGGRGLTHIAMARLRLSHGRPEMSRLSLWLDDQERELAMPHRVDHAVRMCLEETVVNLIDHTASPKERPDITVDFAWRGDVMVAVIEDRGPPFDPRDAAPPPRPTSLDDAVPGASGSS
jgi:anti-sigma regulatory factor (Ser/Thr protein kinase)